jgi:hypothetical protein
MSLYPYAWSPKADDITLFDIDCEIDAAFDPDEECIEVMGVFIDGVDLTALSGDEPEYAALTAICERIVAVAEADTDLLDRVADDQGYSFSTRGGTDPDAHWVDVA